MLRFLTFIVDRLGGSCLERAKGPADSASNSSETRCRSPRSSTNAARVDDPFGLERSLRVGPGAQLLDDAFQVGSSLGTSLSDGSPVG